MIKINVALSQKYLFDRVFKVIFHMGRNYDIVIYFKNNQNLGNCLSFKIFSHSCCTMEKQRFQKETFYKEIYIIEF